MGTEPGMVAVLLPASAAWTVKAKVPALLGVPETVPSDASVRPPGKAPPLIVHEYGCTPPVADNATGAYATPTSPLWKGAVAMSASGVVGVGEGDGVGVGVGCCTVEVGRTQAAMTRISAPMSALRTLLPSLLLRTNREAKSIAGYANFYPSKEIASRNFSKNPFETFSGLPVRPPTLRSRAFCSAVKSLGTTTWTRTY